MHETAHSWNVMLRSQLLKRAMDILGAGIALILFSPLLLVVAGLVLVTMGRPILFRQTRPGLNQKPFEVLKFRSMKNATDAEGKPLSDEARLSKFGALLRNLSLDELPQIINILRGDMSIVGPRPLLYDFFPYYSPEEMRRHEVKPGITGLAQINGRNNLNWDARLKMDVDYVDRWNVWMDIQIIFKTVWTVLAREGVTTEGHATFLRLDDYRKGLGTFAEKQQR
jgi:lipopolysaccharide/colanic/teichoic acid biosynthesis glycosyltransferase